MPLQPQLRRAAVISTGLCSCLATSLVPVRAHNLVVASAGCADESVQQQDSVVKEEAHEDAGLTDTTRG